ncbi:MAG: hypothetical protein CMB99_00050 [Flavobacteriaceae bacterium]|jgi:hypothetical protein|nr:hypothetical protein [Flavobacteriaceae bacterium]|tara:strand:+ start:23249 stop:24085 length:837 start_codon:yes stop_codon:yes gene_type:complete
MADVKNPKFVIGNATVMIAPYSEDAFALNPTDHSVGMVKAVTMEQQSDQIMLKNGIQQLTVDTQKSNVNMTTTFEGYEFDARNLTYALGIAGSTVKRLRGTVDADAAADATTLSIASAPIAGDATTGIDDLGDIPSGATLIIQNPDQKDEVYVVATTAATTGTGPFDATVEALPAAVKAGWTVWIVNEIATGSFEQDDYFCAKIVGTLSANDEPIVVVIPKLKITRGFNLAFSETDYSNLPFELSPIVMTRSEETAKVLDNPRYAGLSRALAKAYAGG